MKYRHFVVVLASIFAAGAGVVVRSEDTQAAKDVKQSLAPDPKQAAAAAALDQAVTKSDDQTARVLSDAPPSCDICDSGKPGKSGWFFVRFFDAYRDAFIKSPPADEGPEPPRRTYPGPFDSPPFPSAEYQGYPVVGVPYDTSVYPLTEALYGGPFGNTLENYRIRAYGWFNASANLTNSHNSSAPTSYWIFPNEAVLDQAVFRLERQVDSVQEDHVDVGFRSTFLYGTDYRYMTAGGWNSDQLLRDNRKYGYDFTEQYVDIYIPKVCDGLITRVGRWIACPDIETQFAPDNYMGSHSLLFTVDTYTQTGIMETLMVDKQWQVQAGVHAGTDMAPWYPGAIATGMLGLRYVTTSNNDSFYLVLNSINDAKFRYFKYDGKPAGHDNFNYVVGTWQHTFNSKFLTKTEAYYMWQNNAPLGGTPSIGPTWRFGGGGGLGAPIHGQAITYGAVNYTMYELTKKDFVTLRNEYWRDVDGERDGFRTPYTSSSIGETHNFNSVLQIRPEFGYYHSIDKAAFDLGKKKDLYMLAADVTLRF